MYYIHVVIVRQKKSTKICTFKHERVNSPTQLRFWLPYIPS
nr:MAG TPA: hypothetical protein [Caudoviricetes sp.]